MSYKNVKNYLEECENPNKYNFELECCSGAFKELKTFARYFRYKASEYNSRYSLYDNGKKFARAIQGKYNNVSYFDADGSGAYIQKYLCWLSREIYRTLWAWDDILLEDNDKKAKARSNEDYKIENKYGVSCFSRAKMGPDTMNSVQTILKYIVIGINPNDEGRYFAKPEGKISINYMLECYAENNKQFIDILNNIDKSNYKKKLSKYIDAYHTIGNFVLVPAYFNTGRGKNDFFDAGLYKLQEEGWDIELQRVNKLQIQKMKSQRLKCVLENEKKLLNDNGISHRLEEFLKELAKMNPQNDVPTGLKEKIKREFIRVYQEKENQEKFIKFSIQDFNKYINTMFLWDYTFPDPENKDMYSVKSLCKGEWFKEDYKTAYNEELECRSSKMELKEIKNFISNALYAIERRSQFMVAMLRIAKGRNTDREEGNLKDEYNGKNVELSKLWEDWHVSGIYKKIMKEVFLVDEVYSDGYIGVINKIIKVIEDTEDEKFVKDILKELIESDEFKELE